ncbi:MAG: TetR/AcrR family transcriptional regulator [Phycisphaerae bacterium]|nr:TetR/AcrR family transcriptional regulator [Phycisphaerae bacterium]
MARPSLTTEKRRELLPIVAKTFAELGFRRTTTAELARRCGVRENILYRLWPDKKAMFIAALDHVYDTSAEVWQGLVQQPTDGRTAAEHVLDHESKHYGSLGHYRIVFAGLSETDDPEVRTALADMYRRYHRFVERRLTEHREESGRPAKTTAALAAWAILGLGTMASIGRELGLMNDAVRARLMKEIGQLLLDGREV